MVQATFNPDRISFKEILEIFFTAGRDKELNRGKKVEKLGPCTDNCSLLNDIRWVFRHIDIQPQHPLFIVEGAEKQVVAAFGEIFSSFLLNFRWV